MAKWIALRSKRIGTRTVFAGSVFDDALQVAEIDQLREQGVPLVDATVAIFASASSRALKARLNGASPEDCDAIMDGSLSIFDGAVTAWAYQPSWKIDSVNGSDDAVGTPSAPLKSWAEFKRRVSYLAVPMSVLLAGSFAGEVIQGRFTGVDGSAKLTIEGVPTVVTTSTGATTFVNPTGNARGTVTATGIDFSLYTGKLLRVVGAHQVLPITSNAAAVGRGGFWANDALATTKPADNTAVEVIDLPVVKNVKIFTDGIPVSVRYLKVAAPSTDGYAIISTGPVTVFGASITPHWFGCIFDYSMGAGIPITFIVGCLFTRASASSLVFHTMSHTMAFYGGGALSAFANGGLSGGYLSFNGFIVDTTANSACVVGGPGSVINDSSTAPLGIFTGASRCLYIQQGATFESGGTTYGLSTGYGIDISRGARFSCPSGTPSITGTTSDFIIDGVTSLVAPPTIGGVWAGQVDLSGASGVGWGKWVAAGRQFVHYGTLSSITN